MLLNHDRSGSFTFTLTEAGSYSASFQLGAKKLPATGSFDWLGQSWLTLKPSPASNVTVALQLGVTNLSANVEGVVSAQAWWASVFGYRAPGYLGKKVSAQAGNYTLVIPGSDDAAASPLAGRSMIHTSTPSHSVRAIPAEAPAAAMYARSIPPSTTLQSHEATRKVGRTIRVAYTSSKYPLFKRNM